MGCFEGGKAGFLGRKWITLRAEIGLFFEEKVGCLWEERGLLCGGNRAVFGEGVVCLEGEKWAALRGGSGAVLGERKWAVFWGGSGRLGRKMGLFGGGGKWAVFEGNSLVYSWGKFLYWTWQ